MLQQQTLREPISYAGIGLHSGNRVNLTFLPASPNSGIRFRRVDLEGKPEIEARIENVSDTNRSTTLSKGNVKVHTVEHVLATFAGFGIDNAVIELDANEPPIGDGSARAYCKMVQTAGVVSQGEPRDIYRVPHPLEVQLGETMISIFPHDHLKISCTSSDKQGRFTQFYSVELSPETWENELAHARTFCFFEEIEFLIKNGLIKGGSLENAVVIRDDAVLTTEPLRFPEEFVRHKMLDILGDLALLGRPLCGHIVAIKPSHSANCELARQLSSLIRKPLLAAQAFAPPPAPKASPPAAEGSFKAIRGHDLAVVDTMELMKILPHRYPFLMVDKVMKIEGNKIAALKNVSINESYFQGHFPNHPIMPGVLQLEAIAQVAGILMLKQAENSGKIAYFMSAESVKWRKPVRPGDQLVIEVELTKSRGKIGKAKGTCSVDGDVVSEAEVTFMLIES
ncbi:MAG: bifunctional UDP-3-O-[3-hydroxymyristoyl] N-acetylglucosamine deacetylase/3-hydroxyacyl-ACP dehydratase [Pedosphaera sp.]|nr:bifunctional UDP-3-O-[3-hydroxymyristoyl] N-acetylglucosamine deacetylase/3-hydroxyacyl-ACP dehydratase [Pedosphaera sp.]